MTAASQWAPVEAGLGEILQAHERPLELLGRGEVPALVMRRAYDPAHCAALVERFYERGLLYDPRVAGEPASRVDVGTSLGRHRDDPEGFFAHARQTHALFETLFEGYDDPVAFMYETLSALAPGKRVMVAREPDGGLYGPAIFRTYYEGVGHTPHFDSARKRSKLFDLQVSRFEKQFAAVLCFQNASEDEEGGHAFLYRRQWSEELTEELPRFREYAAGKGIGRARIDLQPGDFYVFCSETIHEVPPPKGDRPRIVLASFFAMSPEDDEIYVWS